MSLPLSTVIIFLNFSNTRTLSFLTYIASSCDVSLRSNWSWAPYEFLRPFQFLGHILEGPLKILEVFLHQY